LRFEGKSRLGFYPLPLSEAQRIRKFLLFPDEPSSALDPCIGDGVAFDAITSGAELLRYGIELDAYRAEQAKQRIEVPARNGPVRWNLPHSFFRVGKDDLGEGSRQELGEDSPATLAEEDTPSYESS